MMGQWRETVWDAADIAAGAASKACDLDVSWATKTWVEGAAESETTITVERSVDRGRSWRDCPSFDQAPESGPACVRVRRPGGFKIEMDPRRSGLYRVRSSDATIVSATFFLDWDNS